MKFFVNATVALVRASKGCPVFSTLTIMLFFVMFNFLEAQIETLIFGDRFVHWLDPVFLCLFIAYAAYSVHICAIYNDTIKS